MIGSDRSAEFERIGLGRTVLDLVAYLTDGGGPRSGQHADTPFGVFARYERDRLLTDEIGDQVPSQPERLGLLEPRQRPTFRTRLSRSGIDHCRSVTGNHHR